VSDVEVGVFLSGGIDSAVLVALASRAMERPLRTFTVGFGEQEFDEGEAASGIASRFGAVHERIVLSDTDLLDGLPEALHAMDQPSMDGVNVYHVSRAVRERGIKVALSGLGGDEMFGGYPSFGRTHRAAGLWRGPVGGAARGLAAGLLGYGRGSRAEKAAIWLSGSSAASGAYRGSRTLFGPKALARLYRPSLTPLPPPPPGVTPLGEVSWYELTGYMRNTLLRDADVFSMAHALEIRVPFVDDEVARALSSVGDTLVFAGDGSKPLLRRALEDLIPAEVWSRPKRGFTLPFAVWMRGVLRDVIEREIGGEGAARCGVSAARAGEVFRSFLDGRISWSRPWALYTLFRWAREKDVAVAPIGFAA
jgi:asparagine synthase (glutamine-hydrolysing)